MSGPQPQTPAFRDGDELLRRGVVAFRDSEHITAVNLFNKALVHYQGIDFQDGILKARINLAEVALAMGNEPGVQNQLSAIDVITSGNPDSLYADEIRLLRANLGIRTGDFAAAEALLAPLLSTSPERPVRTRIHLAALANRVQIALRRDAASADEWIANLRQTLARTDAPDPVLIGRLHRFEAELALRQGREDEAIQYLLEAYTAYQSAFYRPGIAASLEELGNLDLRRGNFVGAANRLHRALHIRMLMLDRDRTLDLMNKLESAYRSSGNSQKAARIAELRELLQEPGFDDWPRLHEAVQRLEIGFYALNSVLS